MAREEGYRAIEGREEEAATVMPTIEELIEVIAEEAKCGRDQISATTRLGDLNLSSYSMMQLLMRVEDAADASLDDEDFIMVFTMSITDLHAALERSS